MRSMNIVVAAFTSPGHKRKINEDFVAHFEPDNPEELQASGSLYIVADGVGGAAKGERASQYAAQKVLHEYYRFPQIDPGERLQRIFRHVGNEIYNFAEQRDGLARMATTMVAAVVRDGTLTIANVGDSRAYLIREGKALQITNDHNIVGEMMRDGQITENEALHSNVKNRLTRSLGGEIDVRVDLFADIPLQFGDRIFLCSDGLTRYALRDDIVRITSSGTPEDIVHRAIDFANQKGGADNISAILISVNQKEEIIEDLKRSSTIKREVESARSTNKDVPRTRPLGIDRRYIPIILACTVLICIAAIVTSFALVSKSNSSRTETPSAIPSKTPTPTNSSTLTQSATATLPFTLTPTIVFSPEPSVTPQFTECKYVINWERDILEYDGKPARSVWVLLNKKFGMDISVDDFDENYSTRIKCDLDESPECEYKAGSRWAVNGWVLIFPAIQPNTCEDAGGTPIPLVIQKNPNQP